MNEDTKDMISHAIEHVKMYGDYLMVINGTDKFRVTKDTIEKV